MPDNIAKKLSDLMALPVDVMTTIPVYTLRGREELEADGCTGILEYGEERVVLEVRGERVTVTGKNLMLLEFRGTSLTVRGRIAAVQFGEDG